MRTVSRDGTLLAGLPVLVSTDVGPGNAWGLGSSQVLVVQRTGTKVNPSTDSVFDYDGVQVRATAPVLVASQERCKSA